MIIHYNHYLREVDLESLGYRYFATKQEAEADREEQFRNGAIARYHKINVRLTAKGVIRALNVLASHADNG